MGKGEGQYSPFIKPKGAHFMSDGIDATFGANCVAQTSRSVLPVHDFVVAPCRWFTQQEFLSQISLDAAAERFHNLRMNIYNLNAFIRP